MFYMEVSAKAGTNVEQAFYRMAHEVHNMSLRQSQDSSGSRKGSQRNSTEGVKLGRH